MASNGVLIGAVSAAVVLALALATIGVLYATGVFGGHDSNNLTTTTSTTSSETTVTPYDDYDSDEKVAETSKTHLKFAFHGDPASEQTGVVTEDPATRLADPFGSKCDWSPLGAWTLPPVKSLMVWDSTPHRSRHLRMTVTAISGASLILGDRPLRVNAKLDGAISNALQILLAAWRFKAGYNDIDYIYEARRSRYTQVFNKLAKLSVTMGASNNSVHIYNKSKNERYNLDTIYERERDGTPENNDEYFKTIAAGAYEFKVGAARMTLTHGADDQGNVWQAVDSQPETSDEFRPISFSVNVSAMEFASPLAMIKVKRTLKAPGNIYETSWTGKRKVRLMVPYWLAAVRLGTDVVQECYDCRLFVTANRTNSDKTSESWSDKGSEKRSKISAWPYFKGSFRPTWILVDAAAGRVNASIACALFSYEECKNGATMSLWDSDGSISATSGVYRLTHDINSITINEHERILYCATNESDATKSNVLELSADTCSGRNRLANFTYDGGRRMIWLQRGDKVLEVDLERRMLNKNANVRHFDDTGLDRLNFKLVNSSANMTKWQSVNEQDSEFIQINPDGTVNIMYSQLNLTVNATSLEFVAVGEATWSSSGANSLNCEAGAATITPSFMHFQSNDQKKHVKGLTINKAGQLTIELGDVFKMEKRRDGRLKLSSDSVTMNINGNQK